METAIAKHEMQRTVSGGGEGAMWQIATDRGQNFGVFVVSSWAKTMTDHTALPALPTPCVGRCSDVASKHCVRK
jgi:hypothetical protein